MIEQVEIIEPLTVLVTTSGLQGPPGPPGDMSSLIYDPRGIAADVFDAGHLTGNVDAGTF